MGGSSSSPADDLGALPTQEVVAVGHGQFTQPTSSSARAAPRRVAAQHTDVHEAKIHAFWEKTSFRFDRAGGSKFIWDFMAELTAEVHCELSMHFHCRERLNGACLEYMPAEEGGPPAITQRFAAGKQQILLNKAIDIKRWPLEVYFKYKKGCPDVIPIVLSLVANNVQLVTHLGVQAQGTSLQCTMLRQKAVINGAEYPLEEVYGIASVSKDHDNNAAGEACVICLTDPRNTVVLPCQHLCLCEECASHLQVGAALRGDKCPICRGPIAGIRVFDVAVTAS